MLTLAGFKVECHNTWFHEEEADDVWIRECASRGWVIVTPDKNIENDAINRQAVIESKARIFFLDDGQSKPMSWASAMMVSKERIFQIILNTKGPFFANIAKYGNTSSASMLIAASEWWSKCERPLSAPIVMAAFGAGLNWGALLARPA